MSESQKYFLFCASLIVARTGLEWHGTLPPEYDLDGIHVAEWGDDLIIAHPDKPPIRCSANSLWAIIEPIGPSGEVMLRQMGEAT